MKVIKRLKIVIKVKYFVLIINYKGVRIELKITNNQQHSIKHLSKKLNNSHNNNKINYNFQEQV